MTALGVENNFLNETQQVQTLKKKMMHLVTLTFMTSLHVKPPLTELKKIATI